MSMRFRCTLAAVGVAFVLSFAGQAPAEAGGWRGPSAGYGYAYDPYGYRYIPRGYYPHYNSRYWRPAYQMRGPRVYYRPPPYYPAWGYPVGGCRKGCNKRRHHRRHRRHW